MSDPLHPLAEGEHIDLDTGTTVKRDERHGNRFKLKVPRQIEKGKTRMDMVELEDEEIRQIAELAGYTVTDEPDGDR